MTRAELFTWLSENYDLTECEHGFRLYDGHTCPNEDCERQMLRWVRDAVYQPTAPAISVKDARKIVDERSNGALMGISAGKGGRAWLDGEWQLCELEALCVLIRAEAGNNAEGAEELLAIQQEDDR